MVPHICNLLMFLGFECLPDLLKLDLLIFFQAILNCNMMQSKYVFSNPDTASYLLCHEVLMVLYILALQKKKIRLRFLIHT